MMNIVCNDCVLMYLKTIHVLKLVQFQKDVGSQLVDERIVADLTEQVNFSMIYAVHARITVVMKHAT